MFDSVSLYACVMDVCLYVGVPVRRCVNAVELGCLLKDSVLLCVDDCVHIYLISCANTRETQCALSSR